MRLPVDLSGLHHQVLPQAHRRHGRAAVRPQVLAHHHHHQRPQQPPRRHPTPCRKRPRSARSPRWAAARPAASASSAPRSRKGGPSRPPRKWLPRPPSAAAIDSVSEAALASYQLRRGTWRRTTLQWTADRAYAVILQRPPGEAAGGGGCERRQQRPERVPGHAGAGRRWGPGIARGCRAGVPPRW